MLHEVKKHIINLFILGVLVVVSIVVYSFITNLRNSQDIETGSQQASNVASFQSDGEIEVDIPFDNQVISSPLGVYGKAKGVWFFEGEASVNVVDSRGQMLGRGNITAVGDAMTEDFVDFNGEIEFETGESKEGKVVLRNANPSGLVENEKIVEIPVIFE
jgi:hypothetical protein